MLTYCSSRRLLVSAIVYAELWSPVLTAFAVMTATHGAVSVHAFAPESDQLTDDADFTHDMARTRTFRWGEDGIAGVSDSHGLQNIAFAFWNEKDDFLKERLFGLSNPQGNHGESLKECHFHLDNTPTVCPFDVVWDGR
jgi:hypothetical protein